jgi:hypothetical protein
LSKVILGKKKANLLISLRAIGGVEEGANQDFIRLLASKKRKIANQMNCTGKQAKARESREGRELKAKLGKTNASAQILKSSPEIRVAPEVLTATPQS